ncbi:hypothetical protein ABZW11_30745 [Nonomuraea sp. NPDC004580]|uniref:hypothetical protein n=1 Tax=Nonomuraea sp. NPDC004580 TaxID=3154552 RepID=UPI0033AE7D06
MRKMIMAVVTAAAITAVFPLAQGTAHADPVPSDCHSGIYYQKYKTWASCNSGSGYVRAVAKCPTGTTYGPWVVVSSGVAGQSVATCSGNRNATGHSYQIKKY